jgi:hypothetical protein
VLEVAGVEVGEIAGDVISCVIAAEGHRTMMAGLPRGGESQFDPSGSE